MIDPIMHTIAVLLARGVTLGLAIFLVAVAVTVAWIGYAVVLSLFAVNPVSIRGVWHALARSEPRRMETTNERF